MGRHSWNSRNSATRARPRGPCGRGRVPAIASTASALSACPVTAAMKMSRSSEWLRVGSRHDRRGAGDVPKQRDLAEVLARALAADRLPVHRDLDLSLVDHVEQLAGVTLLEDRGSGRHGLRDESREATSSSAGACSGAKIGIAAGARSRGRARSPGGRSSAAPARRGSRAPGAGRRSRSAPRSGQLTSTGASSAPRPIVRVRMLSTAPNTRPSTSSGTARWSRVGAATSISTSPTPMNASRTIAAAWSTSPTRISGIPQRNMPKAKSARDAGGRR